MVAYLSWFSEHCNLVSARSAHRPIAPFRGAAVDKVRSCADLPPNDVNINRQFGSVDCRDTPVARRIRLALF